MLSNLAVPTLAFSGQRSISFGAAATLTAAVVVILAGCAGPASPSHETEDHNSTDFGHVHGLGVDPVTGSVFVATHVGMFEVPESSDGAPLDYSSLEGPIAGRVQDTMGFTIVDGTMWGSGHPGPADLDTSPANLGLIRSDDDAVTWTTVSLSGEADFHDIAIAPSDTDKLTIYGYDSSTGTILISVDSGESWNRGATLDARDLTVGASGEVYATTPDGLRVSSDGARSFSAVDEAPALYLVEAMSDVGGLVGLDTAGVIWVRDAAGAWSSSGPAPGTVEALTYSALPRPILAIASDTGISTSTDGGATWTTRAEDVDRD